jgi:hypothetical protein
VAIAGMVEGCNNGEEDRKPKTVPSLHECGKAVSSRVIYEKTSHLARR